jgi:hypothetical protein
MTNKSVMKIVASLAACLSFGASVCSAFDYSSTVNSLVQFNGDSTFNFTPASNNVRITSGLGVGLIGEITGVYTIGTVTTAVDGSQTAPVTGAGTFVIHDGANDLTATLVWVDIGEFGVFGGFNLTGAANLTGITYSGSNPDLLAIKNAGSAINVLSYQFASVVSLDSLKTSPTSTSFSGTVVIPKAPPCSCVLSFNAPNLTNCAGDAIPDATASQNCGNGSSSVAVTVTGKVTNGVCPQIITRTLAAVDGCGKTNTTVQTITVNCLPICTITPSVTITIVGTANLTASVADAGAGATYAWSVLNGTITAGQNTTKITWTAGTDTNSPITIIIKITSATGCQSTCSASVKLNPKPPGTSLGSGDTATIGFWHNKNGQGLILGASNSPALGNWLASNYPCLFGTLAGQPNSVVASTYMGYFGVKGQKTYAQVMAGAFAVYFTSSSLGGGAGPKGFGFNISPGGTGSKLFNVGNLGTTIGLQNNTSYTVSDILTAANAKCPWNATVFDALNTIFDGINQTGDIN